MYEHPVFCLASQVMDLTIREYLHHPLPSHPPTCSLLLLRLLFNRSLTSISPPPPSTSAFSSEMLLLPCLFFYLCLLSVRVSGGARQLRDLSTTTLNQSGVLLFSFFFFFFFLEPSVCDGHEWAVWSVSFFLLVGCRSFDLNAFLHCLHCYLLQSFGLIMCQWCAVLNR